MTKKKRNKTYHPRGIENNKFLMGMMLSPKAVDDSIAAIEKSLMRQRINKVNAADLSLLAVHVAVGWYLSEKMENTLQLKETFESLFSLLKSEIRSDDCLKDETYNAMLNVLPMYRNFLSNITQGDLKEAQTAIGGEGIVPLFDDFCNNIRADKIEVAA